MKSHRPKLRHLAGWMGILLGIGLANLALASPHSATRHSAHPSAATEPTQDEKDGAAQAATSPPTSAPSSGVSWLEILLLIAVMALAGLTFYQGVRLHSFRESITSDIVTHGNLLDDLKRKMNKDISPRLTQCEATAKEASTLVASYGPAFKTIQSLPPFKARQLLEKAASEVTGRGDSWPGSGS